MDCKLKPSILTTLVIISITFISSEPVAYGQGFQSFSRRVARRDDHGPQHFVVPIMRNNNHFTDKHQHIVKENYVQPPSTEPVPETFTTNKPVEVTTATPEVTTATTTTIMPQGRTLTATKEPLSRMQQVKVYRNYQTLKTTTPTTTTTTTTTTTKKPKVEPTTPHIRQSATEPTTTNSPLKMTTKQIPEIRNGNQETGSSTTTEKNQGESKSKDEKAAQPITGVTQTAEETNKAKTSEVLDHKKGIVKKHRHRHHSRHGHDHQKHHRLSKGNHTHGKSHHHRSHNPHKNKTISESHRRHFHGIKSSIRGNSHIKKHERNSEGYHGLVSGAYHGRRVKREDATQTKQKRSDVEGISGSGSGESTSIEGNELESDESGSYSESVEDGRDDSHSMSVLDIAPGPYLQHHSEEDDSKETARIDGVIKEPTLNSWSEYVGYQRSSLLADPDTKRIAKNTGFIPVMEPEDHFKHIDKQFKDKNERMIAFHNLQNFIRQQRKKFRIPELPLPTEGGGRVFVDLMGDDMDE